VRAGPFLEARALNQEDATGQLQIHHRRVYVCIGHRPPLFTLPDHVNLIQTADFNTHLPSFSVRQYLEEKQISPPSNYLADYAAILIHDEAAGAGRPGGLSGHHPAQKNLYHKSARAASSESEPLLAVSSQKDQYPVGGAVSLYGWAAQYIRAVHEAKHICKLPSDPHQKRGTSFFAERFLSHKLMNWLLDAKKARIDQNANLILPKQRSATCITALKTVNQ